MKKYYSKRDIKIKTSQGYLKDILARRFKSYYRKNTLKECILAKNTFRKWNGYFTNDYGFLLNSIENRKQYNTFSTTQEIW